MKKKSEETLTPDEELRAENNLLRVKLNTEFGPVMFGGETKMDPEVENKWLKHVYAFEQLYQGREMTTVFKRIGEPVLKPAADLDEKQIEEALEHLINLMGENGICLDCIHEKNARTIYEFILNELLAHEIENVQLDGLFYHFIYEEFHPNHACDIVDHIERFLHSLIEDDWNEYDNIVLANPMHGKESDQMSIETFEKKIKDFQSALPTRNVLKASDIISTFDLETKKGRAEMELQYEAVNESGYKQVFEGKAFFDMVLQHDYWSIERVSLPGFID